MEVGPRGGRVADEAAAQDAVGVGRIVKGAGLAGGDAFLAFDRDDSQSVAILTGRGGSFCAGYDITPAKDDYRAKARKNMDITTDRGVPARPGPSRSTASKTQDGTAARCPARPRPP